MEGAGRKRTPVTEKRAALPPYATQLLNAGCRITSIQKFLGHRRLNTTLVYARVHDQTVASDYYAAMSRVEQRLDLLGEPDGEEGIEVEPTPQSILLRLAEQLGAPQLEHARRLEIVARMKKLLLRSPLALETSPNISDERRPRPPPPASFRLLGGSFSLPFPYSVGKVLKIISQFW